MVKNSSTFDTDSELRPDLADVLNANPAWRVTAAGRVSTVEDLNGTVPDTLFARSEVDRLTSESASPADSTEPANRDDVSLALMLLFDTVALQTLDRFTKREEEEEHDEHDGTRGQLLKRRTNW
jgi:hypothetical protein